MAAADWDPENVILDSGDTVETGTLGEGVLAGEAIFLDASDSLIYNTDIAAADKPASADDIGIALASGVAGQTVPYVKRRGDKVDYGASTTPVFTAGMWYVSGAAGGLMPVGDLAASDYSILIGYAESDQILVLQPSATGTQFG